MMPCDKKNTLISNIQLSEVPGYQNWYLHVLYQVTSHCSPWNNDGCNVSTPQKV